jgi:hypothetical protein
LNLSRKRMLLIIMYWHLLTRTSWWSPHSPWG